MCQESAKSAHFSQFETLNPRLRVVLLGASNLSLALPRVIASARIAFATPLEFFVAEGFGRAYDQDSRFFWKKFSGILRSELWPALERAPPLPTVAIITDVGNDLAYEAPVQRVIDAVTTGLDRLAHCGARIALNNVPLESLRAVGELRFRVMRAALFPRCRLPRGELLARAAALSDALAAIAKTRQIPAFSAEKGWYGLDPIHPRRRHSGLVWQQMLAALAGSADPIAWTAPTRADARLLHCARSSSWARTAPCNPAHPPRAYLADGSSVALF